MAGLGQQRVDGRNLYERLFAIVPVTGKGTWADPKRPLLAPQPSAMGTSRAGIIAFHHVDSDDGQWALVEFVATTPAALKNVIAAANAAGATAAGAQFFERGKTTTDQVQAAFQKLRKNFQLNQFMVVMP